MVPPLEMLTHWEGEPVDVWRAMWNLPHLEAHESLDSTNDRGKVLVEEKAGPWSLILAEGQTGGRGRGGKRWFSPPGTGLWFTLLLPSQNPGWDALLPIRIGMALAGAVDRFIHNAGARGLAVGLKWPNDLLLGGKKVGGILCETAGNGMMVAGIGLNVAVPEGGFPPDLEGAAGALENFLERRISRGPLLGGILGALREGLAKTAGELEPEELREYEARDALKGKSVRSETAGTGVARGLTPLGGLILEGGDGVRVEVRAGSVTPALGDPT